jgi:polyribonucleotide nucleotidyltransferase
MSNGERPTIGRIYDGIVTSIKPHGATVEFMPGVLGFVHISQIEESELKSLSLGGTLEVKLLEFDHTGYMLSRRAI